MTTIWKLWAWLLWWVTPRKALRWVAARVIQDAITEMTPSHHGHPSALRVRFPGEDPMLIQFHGEPVSEEEPK